MLQQLLFSYVRLCNPMDCPMPGLSVPHYLPEFAKVHVHIGDAIQPISFSVTCFSRPQSFPASGSLPMCQLFIWGGQIIGALASVLPVSIQGWFLLGWTVWSPCCPRDSQETSQVSKASVLQHSAFFMVQLSYLYMTTGKTTALTIQPFVSKIMSLLFNTLSRFVTNRTQIQWGRPSRALWTYFRPI